MRTPRPGIDCLWALPGRRLVLSICLHAMLSFRFVRLAIILVRPSTIAATALGSSSLRTGLFVGSMVSSYRIILQAAQSLAAKTHGTHRVGGGVAWWWIPLAAGTAAGSSALLEENARRYTIALYLFPRAAGILLERFTAQGYLPKIPYGSFLVFLACQVREHRIASRAHPGDLGFRDLPSTVRVTNLLSVGGR